MYTAPAAGHGGTPRSEDHTGDHGPDRTTEDRARETADAHIGQNEAEIDRLQRETWEQMQAQDRRQTAAVEGQFYTGMAIREVGQEGQDFADGFVKFVETREQVALNKLEAQHNREDIPYPDAVSDWISFGDELQAKENRRGERMDLIGDLMEGKLPDRARES